MRQNGLRASSFVPVVDVDPRVADQLLDLLRLADVAAYSEPAPGQTGVYRDHHVPSRRLDRLWVDRTETVRARGVLDRALPHLQRELDVAIRDGVAMTLDPGRDAAERQGREAVEFQGAAAASGVAAAGEPVGPEVPITDSPVGEAAAPPPGSGVGGAAAPPADPDEAAVEISWAAIVAGFDAPVAGPSPWPSAEDLPGPRITRLRRPVRPAPELDFGDDGEHFVPPPPLPLPHLDAMTRIGWAAVIGGPVLLVLVVLFGRSLPGWVPLLGVLTLVGGFGLLVSRLRPSTDDDDTDHHDGAVV
jgi:hypothetical protein